MSVPIIFKFIKWINQFDVSGRSVPCFGSSNAILVLVRLVFKRYLSVERNVTFYIFSTQAEQPREL